MTRHATVYIIGITLGLLLFAGGCKQQRIPITRGDETGTGLARVQQEIDDAEWHNQQLRKVSGARAKPHQEAITYSHQQAQGALVDAATAYSKVRKAALKLNDAYASCKWVGWQTRHYWHLILALYLGFGAASVVLGLTGFMGVSRIITQNLFFMSPFVWIRDWLIRRNGGDPNTTTIVVQSQPASVSVDQPSGATPVRVEQT